MSEGRGPNPEYQYPDFQVLMGLTPESPESPEHTDDAEDTEDEDDRIATEGNREEEALQGHKRPSLWKRFLGR